MTFGYYEIAFSLKTMFLSVMGTSIERGSRYHKQPEPMHWPESK